MTDRQLLKAQEALRKYQKSKRTFKCNVCGQVIRLAPPIPKVMQHKDCSGVFVEVKK